MEERPYIRFRAAATLTSCASAFMMSKASEPGWNDQLRKNFQVERYKLRRNLMPYLPYVDKPSGSLSYYLSGGKVDLDENWIDLRVIRSWLEACDNFHGSHCRSATDCGGWTGPQWFIDVIGKCVVPAVDGAKYFALSYVWGNASSSLHASRASIERLQEEGSLTLDTADLPETIKHAMQLVELLGRRYLWVDRLCIVQDDVDKQDQLSHMNAIYAGAYATIVAAQGKNAKDGLKGIRHVSEARSLSNPSAEEKAFSTFSQSEETISDTKGKLHYAKEPADWFTIESAVPEWHPSTLFNIARNDDENPSPLNGSPTFAPRSPITWGAPPKASTSDLLQIPTSRPRANSFGLFYGSEEEEPQPAAADKDILEMQARSLIRSTWYERGWTFQEQIFSRRKIILQDETVNWECHCTAWHEGQHLDNRKYHRPCDKQVLSRDPDSFDDASWPDMYRYARLVSLFNERLLTYPEDALDAFAGVLSASSRSFTGGFISGLPQMFFNGALLWQPYHPLERRVCRNPQKQKEACLPSWSWVGWHGVLHYESLRSCYDYISKNPDEYYQQGKDRLCQRTSWHTYPTVTWYIVDAQDSQKPISSTGHMYREQCLNSLGNSGDPTTPSGWNRSNCSFSFDGKKSIYRHHLASGQDFWYPVPLHNPVEPSTPPLSCCLIKCRTQRAFVRRNSLFKNDITSRCVCADLVMGNGSWIGVLRFPFGDFMRLSNGRVKHELIELSRGEVMNQETEEVSFDEWNRGIPWSKEGKYVFYNVMSIHWLDGVAYRDAVGRVEKSAWEKLEKDEIEVTLG